MDELRKHVATSALHDTSTRQNDHTTECHPQTRQLLLQQLVESPVFVDRLIHWFWGPVGAGKTSVMRSLARRLEAKGDFAAGFYFWRSDGARNSLKNFFPTLAVQLADNDTSTASHIEQAIKGNKGLLEKSFKTQMEKLIITPLVAGHRDSPSTSHPRVFVIDGLDECDSDGQREFLEELLPALISRLSDLRITVFVSSRPEPGIENRFSHPRLSNLTNRICLEASEEDVHLFLVDEFEEINRCHPGLKDENGGKWPGMGDLETLEDKSSGYFILVKTAMRYIKPDKLRGRAPDQRLRDVLEAFRADPLRPLDALYLSILRQNCPEGPADFEEWKTVIGLICIPLECGMAQWTSAFGSYEYALFIRYGKGLSALQQMISELGSLFYIEEHTGQLRNYHASFADCVFNPERGAEFAMDPGRLHERIACALVESMSTTSTFLALGGALVDPRSRDQIDYISIMKMELLTHFKHSRACASAPGGALDTLLGDATFSQVLLQPDDILSTICQAGLMWAGLDQLFKQSQFDSLSRHRATIMAKLYKILDNYLSALRLDETADYLPLFYLLGCFFCQQFSVVSLLPYSLARIRHYLATRLQMVTEESLLGSLPNAVITVLDDLGLSRLRPFSHILDDDMACISLILREMRPSGPWLSLKFTIRDDFHVFLILHSLAHQTLLTRMWETCNIDRENDPIGASFIESRQYYLSADMIGTLRRTILQYFNLCAAAGMQPEGMSESQTESWLDWSSREVVPSGFSTIAESFDRFLVTDVQPDEGTELALTRTPLVEEVIKEIPVPVSLVESAVDATPTPPCEPKQERQKKTGKRDKLKKMFGWRASLS